MSIVKRTLEDDIEVNLEWRLSADLLAQVFCTGLGDVLTHSAPDRIVVEIVHALNETGYFATNTVRIRDCCGFVCHEIRVSQRAVEALGMLLGLTLDDLKSVRGAIRVSAEVEEGPPVLKALARLEGEERGPIA